MKADVARYEPILYIPNKCIISTETARASPIAHVFDSHDGLFVTNYDRDQMILIVYLIYERLKGEESFFHPYLDMVDAETPTPYWPDEVIEKSDLQFFKWSLKEAKERLDSDWEKLNNFFSIYPDYFDPERLNKEIYVWAYSFISSRVFGWGFPATMLVPMGDCLNHMSGSCVTPDLFEKNLHKTMNKIYMYKHKFDKSEAADDEASDGDVAPDLVDGDVDKVYDKSSSKAKVICTKLFSEDELGELPAELQD